MKKGIHPKYGIITVTCSCGNIFQTRDTSGDLKIELCSSCHPFFTGTQKLVDTAGRVEKYYRRFGQNNKKENEQEQQTKEIEKQ